MKCEIDGCDDYAKCAGLCGKHYKRKWRHGDATKTLTPGRGFERIQCIAEDVDPCELMSEYACGLCETHYNRKRMYGRTYRIIAERGLGTIDAAGYILLTIDGRRVHEHVYLAEQALGKRLPKGAIVHHMNRNPRDNFTPYNLIVCPDQAYHMLLHRRMKELGI